MTSDEEPLPELLERVGERVRDLVAAEERVRALLDAVVAVAGELDLHATLQRIVESAAVLANARYVALGVLNRQGDGLVDFITYGLTEEERAAIGPLPRGHGILGLLISDARPIRLSDLAEHNATYGFPEHHPPMRSFLGVPVRVRDRVFGNLYLTEKQGAAEFTGEDEQAIVALAAAAGVAVENARLYEQVRRRERWLAATADVQSSLLGRVDRADALAQVAARARESAGADLALVVLEQDDGELRAEAVDGADEDLSGFNLPRDGALGDVVDRGATVHLAEGVELSGLESVATAMLVPFTGPAGAGGALLVGSHTRQGDRWLEGPDLNALRGFAAQAALALDRAQAQEDRSALAVLEDRDRIARDLHDLVIQRLFATGLTLQGATRKIRDPDVVKRLSSVVDNLDETIRDIRGTIFELGRGADTEQDLRGQVRDVVADAETTLGYRPRLLLSGPLDTAVPDGVRPHLVAFLIEALSNAARHAHAEHIDVRVAVEGTGDAGEVVATVRDDGKGFESLHRQSGLRNLRDRAATVGGTFDIESAPGEGTLARWTAPLRYGLS
ncbi:MAG TPA: GAF domain-containing sensor histidine kinase [Nocardioidaceae bacterium]|nr:GAF domain-containing sensor histidine kinase [Nocardioidaceae bacterium]